MWKAAMLCALALCQAGAEVRLVSAVVYNTSVPPHSRLPVYDRGYLIVTYSHGDSAITVYGPDGGRLFDTAVKLPHGESLQLGNSAVDSGGTMAVAVTYTTAQGYGGAIAFFNRIGRQTKIVDTGHYLPTALAFDPRHQLWTAGWQRDPADYFVIHRFSAAGVESGAFVRRSSFPAGLDPGHVLQGEKGLHVADGRIGALLASGKSGDLREWLELDLDGSLLGRWRMDHIFGVNLAFTSDGRIYGSTPLEKGVPGHLTAFDRNNATWKTVPTGTVPSGPLMGADGQNIVVWEQGSDPMLLLSLRPTEFRPPSNSH